MRKKRELGARLKLYSDSFTIIIRVADKRKKAQANINPIRIDSIKE